jgi:hypothetical protein
MSKRKESERRSAQETIRAPASQIPKSTSSTQISETRFANNCQNDVIVGGRKRRLLMLDAHQNNTQPKEEHENLSGCFGPPLGRHEGVCASLLTE